MTATYVLFELNGMFNVLEYSVYKKCAEPIGAAYIKEGHDFIELLDLSHKLLLIN